jgi:hypothetical protein
MHGLTFAVSLAGWLSNVLKVTMTWLGCTDCERWICTTNVYQPDHQYMQCQTESCNSDRPRSLDPHSTASYFPIDEL